MTHFQIMENFESQVFNPNIYKIWYFTNFLKTLCYFIFLKKVLINKNTPLFYRNSCWFLFFSRSREIRAEKYKVQCPNPLWPKKINQSILCCVRCSKKKELFRLNMHTAFMHLQFRFYFGSDSLYLFITMNK